jgi:hypothetical protein
MIFKLLILFLLLIYFKVFIFKENLKTNDVALCMIAKNENLYIKEFVEYYKNLGIKKIYLYDNNDINGENFNTILNSYINSKFIKVKNIRGKSEIQLHAYNDCYQRYLNEYSWFIFLDVDEFLYIKNNKTISNFLSDKRFLNCNTIFINYNEYGDSDLLKYDNRSIFKRFTQSQYGICGKSLTRGGIKRAKIDINKPLNINNYCNSEGESEELYKNKIFTSKITVDSVEIKHFITKSLEEFCQRLKKGWPCVKKFSKGYYEFVEGRIKYYFSLNKINEYKYNALKSFIINENYLNELKFKLKKSRK